MTIDPNSRGTPPDRVSRLCLPLVSIVLLECGWMVYLAASRRIPIGHDGLQFFYLKYYFFNDVVRHGEIAQWIPYLTHGSPGAWWYIVQSGIFDPLAMAAASLLRLDDFIWVFYAILLGEKLLLVVGTWLLASEHFSSRQARFVATAALASSTIWYTQVWWNFHAMVALPMMLYFAHRMVREARLKWGAALALLLFLQTFGQLSYTLPMTLFFLAVYLGLVLAPRTVRASLVARVRVEPLAVLVAVLVLGAAMAELQWLQRASREIVFRASQSQRQADGTVALATFLNYGGLTDLRAWNEFLFGLTPHLDFTLFAGFLIVGLSFFACLHGSPTRAQLLFGRLSVIVLLLATASPLAAIVFYFWPLARLFRHLALLTPVAGAFVVFFAAATCDRLVTERPAQTSRPAGLLPLVIALAVCAAVLVAFFANGQSLDDFITAMSSGSLPTLKSFRTELIHERVVRSLACLALTAAALVGLVARWRSSTAASIDRWAWIACLALVIDVSTYELLEMRTRTVRLDSAEAAVFRFTDLPYTSNRPERPDDLDDNRRLALARIVSLRVGQRYWSESALWLRDAYQTSTRTVFWAEGLDGLFQAAGHGVAATVTGDGDEMTLPTDGPLPVIGGFAAPKVRFFTDVAVCPDVASTGALVGDPEFRGQVPLLTATPAEAADMQGRVNVLRCEPESLTRADESLSSAPTHENVRFTSNEAEFRVENPLPSAALMTYADTWSPHWTVSVSGKAERVFRSDLGYKAVVVPPGTSLVSFRYEDRLATWVYLSQSAAAASFVVFLGFLGVARIRRPMA